MQLLDENNVGVKTIKFSSVNSLRACLGKGIGFTLSPLSAIEKEVTLNQLVPLNWTDGPDEVSLMMIWHVDKWCSPVLKRFMAMAEEMICI